MAQAEGSTHTNKPRLLIVLNRFVIGGQAVDTIPLAWHLQNDFDILILYGEKEKDEIEPGFLLKQYPGLRLKKLKHLRRSVNPFVDILAFYCAWVSIKNYRADIVHTHGAKSGFIGRICAWLCGVPVIIHTFHGHLFHSYFSTKVSGIIAAAERLLGKITTAAIALSDAQKLELSGTFTILPPGKIYIIPLGFASPTSTQPSLLRQQFRDRYKLQETDVAVGIVGRIVPVKNHSFFVQVIKCVLAQTIAPQPAFLIIGDGNMRTQVERELQENNILFSDTVITPQHRVLFTSWLTDMDEVMNGLDIVALTSLNEGTPLSIIEAQFFKRPVVSTDAGGVKDTMQDGVTGFITGKDDTTTFCEKLRFLINDSGLRQAMGEKGLAFVDSRFSKQTEVASTRTLYISLLSQAKKRS